MIAATPQTKVTGNITGHKIAMGIHADAMEHIMFQLANLYSDNETAVLREYATNAWDSHVEAGNTAPIEIWLPSELSPYLRIKDYGMGMAKADIEFVYSQYGASTKRESNDYNGTLGFGCKSALAYTPSFDLIGIKDGTRTLVSISREEDGGGSMTVMEESSTDLPDGVEVIIPAGEYNTFATKAQRFFQYWDQGTVLVNGEEPTRVDGLWLNDTTVLVEGGRDMVVMGNVPYPTDFNQQTDYGVVAFVPIGDVNFAASREALRPTPVTETTLERLKEEMQRDLIPVVQAKIDECATRFEAIQQIVQWRDALRYFPGFKQTQLGYKGEAVPKTISDQEIRVTAVESHKISAVSKYRVLSVENAARAIFVWNFTPANLTPNQKKKMLKWAEDNNIEGDHFVLVSPQKTKSGKFPASALKWIRHAPQVEWSEVNKIILPRVYTGKGNSRQIQGSYDAWIPGALSDREIPADEIDTSLPIFWTEKNGFHYKVWFDEFYPNGYTMVELSPNRVAKFERTFPQARKMEAAFHEMYGALAKRVKRKTILQHALIDDGGDFRSLDADRVEDPELAYYIKLSKTKAKTLKVPYKTMQKLKALARMTGNGDKFNVEVPALAKMYPLVDIPNPWYNGDKEKIMDHNYVYINAAYAANLKGKN